MSNLTQFIFIGQSGFSTSLTVNEFIVQDVRLCGFFDEDTDTPLGSRFSAGSNGFVVCRSSSTAWLVAPRCGEVSRTWYCRNDAITLTESCTGIIGGWFIPTVSQLQNPGFTCRQYWDSFSSTCYWSSTERLAASACVVTFLTGAPDSGSKAPARCVRAFRCVTY